MHEELALQWVMSGGAAREMAFLNAWFFLELMVFIIFFVIYCFSSKGLSFFTRSFHCRRQYFSIYLFVCRIRMPPCVTTALTLSPYVST